MILTKNTNFDVIVCGAGPAGVIVARMLAEHGYRVALISRVRHFPAIEGLSERAYAGLHFAGCEHALCFLQAQAKRQANWGGQTFAGNNEWIVDRTLFDSALLEDARAGGITLIEGRVGRISDTGGRWQVGLSGASSAALHAGFLVEARGRSAPHRVTALQRGPATTALGRCWDLSDNSHPMTEVVSFAEGWAWFAMDGSGGADNNGTATGIVHIFVDSGRQRLPGRAQLQDYYHELLNNLAEARQWLQGAQPKGAVFARYAHAQLDTDLITSHYARVGDAAFAIDPLSGHGLFEAAGGALVLSAVVNTILARPQDALLAERFYREKIDQDFHRMARIGRDFYRMEQRWPERVFWQARQDWPDNEPAHAAVHGAQILIEPRPVNVDGFIEEREVIITPDHPRGIWQVAGIPLVALLAQLGHHEGHKLPDIARALARRDGGRVEDYHAALDWLALRGLLFFADQAKNSTQAGAEQHD